MIEVSRSHSDSPQSAGLLWKRDQPDTGTSTWLRKTLTRDKHPFLRQVSNPHCQQAIGRRSAP